MGSDTGDGETPKIHHAVRELISDAFAFIRSAEANRALASVTLDDLIEVQIARNGESDAANAGQYNPYIVDSSEAQPASEEVPRVDYVTGTAGGSATKLDRLLSIKNSLGQMVEEIKKLEPSDVASEEEYTDANEDTFFVEL